MIARVWGRILDALYGPRVPPEPLAWFDPQHPDEPPRPFPPDTQESS